MHKSRPRLLALSLFICQAVVTSSAATQDTSQAPIPTATLERMIAAHQSDIPGSPEPAHLLVGRYGARLRAGVLEILGRSPDPLRSYLQYVALRIAAYPVVGVSNDWIMRYTTPRVLSEFSASDRGTIHVIALLALASRPDTSLVPFWEALLASDSSALYRQAALPALACIKGPAAVPLLEPLVNGADRLLRDVATSLVSKLTNEGGAARVCVGGFAAQSEAMTFRPLVEGQ
jgi:hypothetical protein